MTIKTLAAAVGTLAIIVVLFFITKVSAIWFRPPPSSACSRTRTMPTPKPSQKTFRRQHAPSVRKFRSCTLLDGSRTAWELRVSPCLPNGPASARCLASQCCNRESDRRRLGWRAGAAVHGS